MHIEIDFIFPPRLPPNLSRHQSRPRAPSADSIKQIHEERGGRSLTGVDYSRPAATVAGAASGAGTGTGTGRGTAGQSNSTRPGISLADLRRGDTRRKEGATTAATSRSTPVAVKAQAQSAQVAQPQHQQQQQQQQPSQGSRGGSGIAKRGAGHSLSPPPPPYPGVEVRDTQDTEVLFCFVFAVTRIVYSKVFFFWRSRKVARAVERYYKSNAVWF